MNKSDAIIGKRLNNVFVFALCLTIFFVGFGNPSGLAASIHDANQPGKSIPDHDYNESMQSRLNELLERIARVKADLEQLRLEMQSLLAEKQQLLNSKPKEPPSKYSKDYSPEAYAAYKKARLEWNNKMVVINEKIARKQQEIDYKQAQLARLEEEKKVLIARKIERLNSGGVLTPSEF